ncbi:MAG: hypothetical protein ABWZ99_07620, partial [Ilumatobacteraceae bacterium]
EFTVIEPSSVELQPDASVEVPTVISIPSSLAPGQHSSEIAVSVGNVDVATAGATVDVTTAALYAARVAPVTSKSASRGRHRVTVENQGNVPLDVTLNITTDDATITIEPTMAQFAVVAGERAFTDVTVVPVERFWSGAPIEHAFTVTAIGSDGQTYDMPATYEQRPRLRSWWGPALAGALAALAIGAIVWFAVLAPWVESTADDAAAEANAADRATLEDKIAELDAAAAEAAELPLGAPADLRLAVEASAGESGTDSFSVGSSVVWSVTDIIFQNPTGAAGQVALLRDGEVLMESELANFRDLDFHLVAPFVFEGGTTIELAVTCDAPGPGQDSCGIGMTLAGFTDETD